LLKSLTNLAQKSTKRSISTQKKSNRHLIADLYMRRERIKRPDKRFLYTFDGVICRNSSNAAQRGEFALLI
jgi:hypothetical protein